MAEHDVPTLARTHPVVRRVRAGRAGTSEECDGTTVALSAASAFITSFPTTAAAAMTTHSMAREAQRTVNPVSMRVMLVDDDLSRRCVLEDALCGQGHRVVAQLDTRADLLLEVRRHQPDVILIDVDAPGRDTLESLDRIHRDVPRPIVMFSCDGDPESIKRAVRAGVSAYVVDGLDVGRLKSIIDVAIARFDEYHTLRRELDDTRTRLADRQDVEKAKGLLMRRRDLTEEAAYALLRKVAMDRNLRLGEAARIVIAAAEIL